MGSAPQATIGRAWCHSFAAPAPAPLAHEDSPTLRSHIIPTVHTPTRTRDGTGGNRTSVALVPSPPRTHAAPFSSRHLDLK